jgi:hypothetical protein
LIIRLVNPVPAPENAVPVVPEPKINSFAEVVAAEPLLAAVPDPVAATLASSGLSGSAPEYSTMRMSG